MSFFFACVHTHTQTPIHTVGIQLPSVDRNSVPNNLTIDLEIFGLVLEGCYGHH